MQINKVEEKHYWTTKDGVRIEVKDMETSHIINALNFIENKCIYGFTVTTRYGGSGSLAEDMWYDESQEYYEGKRALRYFENSDYLFKELKEREKRDNKKYVNEDWHYVSRKI